MGIQTCLFIAFLEATLFVAYWGYIWLIFFALHWIPNIDFRFVAQNIDIMNGMLSWHNNITPMSYTSMILLLVDFYVLSLPRLDIVWPFIGQSWSGGSLFGSWVGIDQWGQIYNQIQLSHGPIISWRCHSCFLESMRMSTEHTDRRIDADAIEPSTATHDDSCL